MRLTAAFFFLMALMLTACATTVEIPPEQRPVSVERQAQLTRLFDRFGIEEAQAKAAAKEAAAGDGRDLRFLSSLWGSRSSNPAVAARFADALSEARKHEDALVWYQRAFLALAEDDPQRSYVRYDLARQYLAIGKRREAMNLLGNRLALEPLPDELRAKYDALIAEASR